MSDRPEECPHCHGELVDPPFGADETRDVVVERPVRAHVRRYTLRVRYCPHCMKPVRTRVPGVMDGCRYANSVVARAATEFYFHGIPAGVVARMSAVGKQTLFGGLDLAIPILSRHPLRRLPAAVTKGVMTGAGRVRCDPHIIYNFPNA